MYRLKAILNLRAEEKMPFSPAVAPQDFRKQEAEKKVPEEPKVAVGGLKAMPLAAV